MVRPKYHTANKKILKVILIRVLSAVVSGYCFFFFFLSFNYYFHVESMSAFLFYPFMIVVIPITSCLMIPIKDVNKIKGFPSSLFHGGWCPLSAVVVLFPPIRSLPSCTVHVKCYCDGPGSPRTWV